MRHGESGHCVVVVVDRLLDRDVVQQVDLVVCVVYDGVLLA